MDLEKEFLTDVDSEIKTHKKQGKKRINSKAKGNNNENECRKIFDERFTFTNFHRSPSSGGFVGGRNFYRKEQLNKSQNLVFVGDIYCARDDFKFTIEHKAYAEANFWDLFNESSDLHSFMKQSQGDADSVGKSPMLIIKYNNKKRIIFIHEKPFTPIFTTNYLDKDWNCYWLEDLLKQPSEFFFGEKI